MVLFFDFLLLPIGIIAFTGIFCFLKWKNRQETLRPKKNILILSPSGYESVKKRGTEHLKTLDNDFFEKVFFLCPGSPIAHEVSLSPRMKLIDMPYPRWITQIQQLGFKYFALMIGQAYFLSWICDFIKKNEIVVIRSMEPHNTGIKGVLLKNIFKIKHIQDVRANFDLIYLGTDNVVFLPANFPIWVKKISRKCEKIFEGFVYRGSDFVFGGNKNNLDYAIYCGAPLERSAVIRVNIQPDLFDELSSRKNIRNQFDFQGKIIAYCGRLSPEKYPEDVLFAFKQLIDDRKDTLLLFIGDGPDRKKLESFSHENSLTNRVQFLGYKDNQYLKSLFISIDGIICPLAGSVLIEAALAELPIIAYDFEWHSEVIIDRYSGLLVNFRNIPALREATDFLLDHTMEVKHYGRRAREIAYSLLLPDHIVEKEKIIYSCLLD